MLDKKNLIIAVAIIIAAIIYANFNPYASCKRDVKKAYAKIVKVPKMFASLVVEKCGGN